MVFSPLGRRPPGRTRRIAASRQACGAPPPQSNRLFCAKPRGAMRPAEARGPVQSARSVTTRVRPAGSFQERPWASVKASASLKPPSLNFCRRTPCPGPSPAARPAERPGACGSRRPRPHGRRTQAGRPGRAAPRRGSAPACRPGSGPPPRPREEGSRPRQSEAAAATPPGRCTIRAAGYASFGRSISRRSGSPMPRPGQARAGEREHPPVRGHQQQLVGGLRMEEEPGPVAVLELQLGVGGQMALHRPDPAHLGTDDGDRLALDQGFQAPPPPPRPRAPRTPSGEPPQPPCRRPYEPRAVLPRCASLQRLVGEERSEPRPVRRTSASFSARSSISSSLRRARRRC